MSELKGAKVIGTAVRLLNWERREDGILQLWGGQNKDSKCRHANLPNLEKKLFHSCRNLEKDPQRG